MPISPFPIRFLHLLAARASTTSGISDAYALWLQYSTHHWHITRTLKTRLLQFTVLWSSKNPVNSSPAYPEFSCSCMPLLQLPGLLILTRFSNLSTGLRYRSASNTKLCTNKTVFSVNPPARLLSLVCYHHHEIKKYSQGYVMHEDCPPLLAGQKSTSRS